MSSMRTSAETCSNLRFGVVLPSTGHHRIDLDVFVILTVKTEEPIRHLTEIDHHLDSISCPGIF